MHLLTTFLWLFLCLCYKTANIEKTLSEDYPGLDYLGFHDVLNAKKTWYRALWFTIVIACLLVGLFTIYRILSEYAANPSATRMSVKSVEQLLLPQLTICPTHPGTVNTTKLQETLFVGTIEGFTPEDVLNFAYFMLAGSGFQKMNPKKFNATTKARLVGFYEVFRNNSSVDGFFEYFFDTFGLQCDEFLQDCRLGDRILDCCKIFEPEYLIRRGRCFRSIELYQRNFDELGKLRVAIRQPFEMDSSNPTTGEIIAFLAEHKPQIAPFRAEEVCSEEASNISKDACYIQKWLVTFLEAPHNCTYPYMHRLRKTNLKSCLPLTIMDNYESTVEATSYLTHTCILACDRWEYTVAIEKTDLSLIYKDVSNLPYTYRIDVSYNDLQYELIEEVSTVSFAGLIAQIGGQMSLFMGSSILNLIQVVVMSIILFRRTLRSKRSVGVSDQETETPNSWELPITMPQDRRRTMGL